MTKKGQKNKQRSTKHYK